MANRSFAPTANLLPVIKQERAISIAELTKLVQNRYDIIKPEEKPAKVTDYHAVYNNGDIYMQKAGEDEYLLHPTVRQELYALSGVTEKLAKNAPKLFESTLNEALGNVYQDREHIFRMATTENKQKIIRAITTKRYREIDDKEYAVDLPQVINPDEWQAEMVRVEDAFTHLRLTHKREDAAWKKAVGDHARNAIDIRNSEIKQGSVRIQFLKFILTCQNGAWNNGDITDFLRIIHQGGGNPFKQTFTNLLKDAQEFGWANTASLYGKAKQIEVPNPEFFITKAIKIIGGDLKKDMAEFVKGEYNRNPGNGCLYDVSMAFSKTAQLYERDDRFALERAGGQVLNYETARMLLPVKVNAELLKKDHVLPEN